MNLLVFLLRGSWGQVALAVFAGVICGFGGAGLLALVNHALHQPDVSPTVLFWGFCALCLVVLLTRVASEILLIRLGQAIVAALRMQLSRQILASPVRHLEQLGSHRLLATLTEDVSAIATALVTLPMLCIQMATVLGCLVFLGWLSWPLAMGVIGFIGFGILIFRIQEASALRSLKAAREANDDLHHHFRGITEGMKELKLHRHRRTAFLSQGLQAAVVTCQRQLVAGMTKYVIAGSWNSLLLYVALGLLLFGLPLFREIPAETMTGYILVLLYMMSPLEAIVDAFPGFGRAGVSMNKVQELGMSLSNPILQAEETAGASVVCAVRCSLNTFAWERLEMKGVTHEYSHEREDRNFHLGPVDLSFQPGEVVFLIGGNGSGKTTLAMLLLGLYIPEEGEIILDGRSITDEQRDNYRQMFSAVFSDFFLFESLLGIEMTELEGNVPEYLRLLQLDHKVEVFKGKLSTLDLSRGQRKRLALLTALLENRPFYVFDEWAADQDPEFKKLFYTEFLPKMRSAGKTILVITHDDYYFGVADRCLRMDFGQISPVLDTPTVQSSI